MFEQLWPLAATPISGHPAWLWCAFLAFVAALLVFDLRVLHRHDHVESARESLLLTALYVAIALAFGAGVWHFMGAEAGLLYVTAYLVEESLSIDNVFVMSTIFAAFAIPRQYQHRVLFWGIVGVVAMRGVMILIGAAMIAKFEWILYLFGAFLVFTGVKMALSHGQNPEQPEQSRLVRVVRKVMPITREFHGHAFFARVKTARGLRLMATPLLPALIVIETADLVFALDSIPAVLSITTDTFIVFTSNIFAILGLRALYSVLAVMVGRFRYLHYGLAGVLVFIGGKIFWAELVGHVPPALSLGVTVVLLGGAIALSLVRKPAAIGREAEARD
ncbi:conserved membrane hypothetical protein [uncultured Alphaproteobacteria bacterium]|uniref:Integral membrane protein TerC n=1 Tax=uncultured Alphaproteobacteria bacterium TaxID=91750 RepID=A0A212JW09_9PROT|nr:conserved membrane hypothetical protein [uncultured Alphaproteobacteria bacterium]